MTETTKEVERVGSVDVQEESRTRQDKTKRKRCMLKEKKGFGKRVSEREEAKVAKNLEPFPNGLQGGLGRLGFAGCLYLLWPSKKVGKGKKGRIFTFFCAQSKKAWLGSWGLGGFLGTPSEPHSYSYTL